MYHEKNGLRHYRHCINGRWVDGGGAIEVENPATGEVVAVVPAGGAAEAAALVDDAKAAGAEVLTGGHRLDSGRFARGYWYAPTVLGGVDHSMDVMTKEIFGPVVPVMRVADFDAALRARFRSFRCVSSAYG